MFYTWQNNVLFMLPAGSHFDPATQRFIGDDAANLLINQPMRAPWASMIL